MWPLSATPLPPYCLHIEIAAYRNSVKELESPMAVLEIFFGGGGGNPVSICVPDNCLRLFMAKLGSTKNIFLE